MYWFLDTLLSLSPEFEAEYIRQAKKVEGEFQMSSISIIEKEGFDKGIQPPKIGRRSFTIN